MKNIQKCAEVLLPLPFATGFDYVVPEGMDLRPGDYVSVPFGRKQVFGVVWGEGLANVAPDKMKSISQQLVHVPPMQTAMRKFIDWVAWYNYAPRGAVLKMTMSAPEALEPPAPETEYRATGTLPVRMTAKRTLLLEALAKEALTESLIKEQYGFTRALLKELEQQQVLVSSVQPVVGVTEMKEAPLQPVFVPVGLSEAQQNAAQQLERVVEAGTSVTLLDGITGSGKTEVYFRAIAEALAKGGQVLVLLPEIALSVQWLSRFRERFGFPPTLWHSDITPARRRENWKQVVSGHARVVVGARSALFLPFSSLSLIVVDEEHEMSFKQMDGVMYQARDMAVARGMHEKIPVVLASATPSLETLHNARQGRYQHIALRERFFDAQLPEVTLVDMRAEKLDSGHWLSQPLKNEMLRTLAEGQQSLLFLNRRGYAPLVLCRTCGHRYQCPNCSAWLVMHRAKPRLQCHHCGHTAPIPAVCSSCKSEDSLVPYGPGVERLHEEVAAFMPEARISILTSDAMANHDVMERLLNAVANREVDVLIGTQIVAKGHHFSHLALVGVVDADLGLSGGDLRASEKTFQLLTQVAGRAGRESVPGRVMIQSYLPDHPVMQAMAQQDRDGLLELEAQAREEMDLPPFGRLASVIVEGASEKEVVAYMKQLVAKAPHSPQVRVLGPAPAPLTLLRGQYRYRLLVKAQRSVGLQEYMRQWFAGIAPSARIRCKVDIDPYYFL